MRTSRSTVRLTQLTDCREGEKVVLEGEADQTPDQEPGDIVFHIAEQEHDVFQRAGADLTAACKITLAEALCGFSRIVLKHLDGRGIHIDHPPNRVLRPGQVLKVKGEGMPHKKSDSKGDLYLVVDIEFPEDGYLKSESTRKQLQEILPKPDALIEAETIDEVSYDEDADIEDYGAGSGDPRGEWDDEEEEGVHEAQCAQQ